MKLKPYFRHYLVLSNNHIILRPGSSRTLTPLRTILTKVLKRRQSVLLSFPSVENDNIFETSKHFLLFMLFNNKQALILPSSESFIVELWSWQFKRSHINDD